MNRTARRFSRLILRIFALAGISTVFCGIGLSPIGEVTAATAASDPIVGDWNVTYGAPAVVTMTLSNGLYTVTAKTPVQVTGATCFLPVGTVIATFSSTGPNTYSGQHGLWYISNCSFGEWDPMTLTLSGDGNTLTAVLAGGYGTVVFTKVTGQLLGLGDSIAAGYGLGPSGPLTGGPSNGNPHAYPALLAARLGLEPDNLAVEGDPAAGGPDGGVLAQICQSVGSSVNDTSTGCLAPVAPVANLPKLVTLTVGADDIGFDYCMIDVINNGLTPDNPCARSNLTSTLAQLQQNLALDLSLLRGYYPKVPVIVTGYYNPLGNQSRLDLAGCPLTTAAVVVPLISNKEWSQLFKYLLDLYVRESNNIPGVPFQNVVAASVLSAFASQVLTRLNGALSNTVGGLPNVTFVPISIGSQGLCSDSPLIFEPQAHASWVLHTPLFPDAPGSFSFGQQNTCPGPKDPEEAQFTASGSGTVSLIAGQTLDYSYSASPNCVPHPTIAGQQSIMQQILPYVPAGVASSH